MLFLFLNVHFIWVFFFCMDSVIIFQTLRACNWYKIQYLLIEVESLMYEAIVMPFIPYTFYVRINFCLPL